MADPKPSARRDFAAEDPAIAATARALLATGHKPKVAVLLGSGWGPFGQWVQQQPGSATLPYASLPAFPSLSVGGHAANVVLARIGEHDVAVLSGRKHAYENGEADGMKAAIRSLAAAGVQVLIQTNAAGSMDAAMPPGSIMLIDDHLNMGQRSPLVGEKGDDRFVALADAYCPHLRAQAQAAARTALGEALPEGVYAWWLGPQFESPAEIRMLRLVGARAVGMSTVPETILARHAGLRVLALSLLTNMAAGMSDERLSHAHTLASAAKASERAVALLRAVVQGIEL